MKNLFEGLIFGFLLAVLMVLLGIILISLVGLIANYPVLGIACVIPISVAVVNCFTNGELVQMMIGWFF